MGDNVLTKVKKTLKIKRKSGGAEMLIRFNVKNFLSFSEREDGKSEEFSMIAGKVRNKKAHFLNIYCFGSSCFFPTSHTVPLA